MSEPVIPGEIRAFIVQLFATYHTSAEIRAAVKETFDFDVTARQLPVFNPTNKLGERDLGPELKELFWATRQRFQEDIADIPIVHKAYRLRGIDEMYRKSKVDGDFKTARELLEQAASEVGGVFEKNKAGLSLDTLSKEMERLAGAIVRNVKDPEIIARIEQEWGGVADDNVQSRIKSNWGV